MFSFIDLVNIASPFVGKGPNVKICIPPEVKPDTISEIATEEPEVAIVEDKEEKNLNESNQEISKEGGVYELEQVLFDGISKTNLGAVTNVTDQFTIFSLSGSNIFEVISKGCPFDFDSNNFGDNKVVQTILNHVDVTIHRRSENVLDLYVRRSFAAYLWDWLKDSAKDN